MVLKDEIESAYPGINFQVHHADLTDRQQVKSFVSFVQTHSSGVDVLVNNAGVFVPGEVQNEAEGVLEQMLQANLLSAYHITRGLLPAVINNRGHIFNICSVASIMPYPNGGSYSISKYALLGFTKVLREEMKTKAVRVTAILPGATYTSSWEGSELPEERFINPADLAHSVWGAYALSPRSVVEEILIRPQLGDL
jgi:short-subunit dehydrogenase